ncbi:MAG: rod shape-determining protein MreC [Patescibacteria group bacterium]|nr:rod shape-determining protein MreC [Patescibacteria group bacterium]
MNLGELKNRILVIGGVIVISILFLLLDSIGAASGLYNIASIVSVPARLEIKKITIGMNDWLGVVSQVASLKRENDSLRTINRDLLQQISELEECQTENENLKKQLGIKTGKPEWTVEGRVIGNRTTQDNTIQINLGEKDGVREGDIVITGNYAIGVITRVENNISKVTLVTSPSSNIPARGQKKRAEGLVSGEVGFILRMADILPDEKIEEGEIVVTSGVNSEFPAGLILGEVTSIESNPAQATQEAFIKTQVDFTKLDYIFVIRGQEL